MASNMAPEDFWILRPPYSWPAPPAVFSFSSLAEIEACPRRWGLRWASYPNVLGGGYPEPLNVAAVQGSVLHRAVEVTSKAIQQGGSRAQGEGAAVEALKKAGGFSALVRESIDHCLAPYSRNPRVQGSLSDARRTLEGRAADIRAQVQSFVSRLEIWSRPATQRPEFSNEQGETDRHHRSAVRPGVNAEVSLESEEMGFRGIADLILLSPDRCEIRDFKTGAPKDKDAFQLKIYSVLWLSDSERNPRGRQADQLVLSYAANDVSVPVPGPAERRDLEEDLQVRLASAREFLRQTPPPANPSDDLCRHCAVRQLCQPFWDWVSDQDAPADDGWFGDIMVRVLKPHGPTSWDARIEASRWGKPGSAALVRLQNTSLGLAPGQSLRLLNVHLAPPAEDEPEVPLIVTMTASSEAFWS